MLKALSRIPLFIVFLSPVVFAEVNVGDKAPDFTLPGTTGGKISLKDYLGKKNLVLEFYVLDFTPG
jgi:peroxiredoxin Q/BCP